MKKNVTKSITIRKQTSVSETTTLVSESSTPPLRFTEDPLVSNNLPEKEQFVVVNISGEEEKEKSVSKEDSDEQGIPHNTNIVRVEDQEDSEGYCDTYSAKRIIASSLVAAGTGVAMMPVFNNLVKNSAQFGLDVHDNRLFLELSTANTFIMSSASTFVVTNEFIKKHQTSLITPDKWNISLAKVCASFSLIMPLGLLWTTEFNNQKVAGSSGFDEYMAWATFSTLPLIVGQITDSVTSVNSLTDREATLTYSTIGGQIFIYGLSAASLVGRAISFTEVSKNFALIMGFSPEMSLGIGIAAGGVLTSSGVSILEFSTLKNLFEKPTEGFNPKKIALGALIVAEGIWFTLPLVAVGLEETEDWNPLLKSSLFIPLAVSHSIFESSKIYNNLATFYDYIKEGFSNFTSWFRDNLCQDCYDDGSSSSDDGAGYTETYITTAGDSVDG